MCSYVVSNTLNLLKEELIANHSIEFFSENTWDVVPNYKRFTRNFFGSNRFTVSQNLSFFSKALEQVEAIPVSFSNQQRTEATAYAQIGWLFLKEAEKLGYEGTSYLRLKRHVIGMMYRLEAYNGGWNKVYPQLDNVIFQLNCLVQKWKKTHPILKKASFNVIEQELIKKTARYPVFVQLLQQDEHLQNQFFSWLIRDKNAPEPFIEFPRTVNRLIECHLGGRIGKIGLNTLKIKKIRANDKRVIKILTLPFDGVDTSILDESKTIEFKNQQAFTIKEVFETFRDKNYRVGNFEFLKKGITNWNVHMLGRWNTLTQDYEMIELANQRWWEKLPVYEVLNKDQMRARYGIDVDGYHWNVAAVASRGTLTLNYDQTHAYIEIAIPLKDQKYQIFPFGKFARDYPNPNSVLDGLKIFCRNVHATVAYPDENVYYMHREHAYHSFIFTPKEGSLLMDFIKRDIEQSRMKNFVYQIESDNCARWLQEHLERVLGHRRVPNLFKTKLLNAETEGPIKVLFNLIKKLPERFHTPVLTFLHLPLGAAIGTWIIENGKKVKKSLTNHQFWQTAEVYLPAFLHRQKEVGLLVQFRMNRPFRKWLKVNRLKLQLYRGWMCRYKALKKSLLWLETVLLHLLAQERFFYRQH